MDRIASIIKHQREHLGYSLEELSAKTKLTVHQLEAIENGNINYFKDDITYFPFIVRYVCNALKIEYETVKTDVEQVIASFHSTQAIKKVEHREQIHRSIHRKSQKLGKKKKVAIDYTYVGLIVLLTTLLIALLITFITTILPRLSQTPNDEDELISLPTNPGDDDLETPVDPVIPELIIQIEEISFNRYTITNFNEETQVTFIVTPQDRASWMRFTLNNSILSLPATAVYRANQSVVYEMSPNVGDVVTISFGDMVAQNIELLINDQRIELNPRFNSRATNGGNAGSLTFEFKGD